MKSDWLPNEEIQGFLEEAARGNPAGLLAFVAESPLRATDSEHSCLILIRDHDAWFIDGWHDANAPAGKGGQGLQMVNYFDKECWSKLPVPIGTRVTAVRWDGECFVIVRGRKKLRTSPAGLKAAVLDSITGRGLTEEQILHNFGKLDGSTPLDYPPGWGSAD